jgi:hypothetical protein
MHYDLGYIDLQQKPCSPRQSLRPRGLTYVLGTLCYPCLRAGQYGSGAPGRCAGVIEIQRLIAPNPFKSAR